MVNKRLVSIFVLLVMLASFMSIFVGCQEKESIKIPTVQQDVYVYDQDDCINDEVELEINFIIKELNEKTEAEIAVISITGLNDYTIEEYANELFNELGIGKQGKDNGVLLLFSKPDKRVRLEIGRGLEGCLNDSKCGRILDNYFVPYREEGNYTEAAKNTVVAVVNAIAKEYQVELENVEDIELKEVEEENEWIWMVIILVVLITLSIVSSFLGISDGSSYSDSSYGGSSYGGFSGGRSSGGFSGGRSGGGGASK